MLQTLLARNLLLAFVVGILQSPGSPSWDALAQKSSSIVVATVESRAWVIHPEKMASRQKPLPDGKIEVEIPNPRDYIVGSLYRVRVEQTLKKDQRVRASTTVNIFVPGFMASAHSSAPLVEGKKYLLFLEPIKVEGNAFSGTRVQRPGAIVGSKEDFDPKSSFVVVQGGNGAIEINEDNVKVIDQVKAVLNR